MVEGDGDAEAWDQLVGGTVEAGDRLVGGTVGAGDQLVGGTVGAGDRLVDAAAEAEAEAEALPTDDVEENDWVLGACFSFMEIASLPSGNISM